MGHTLEKAEGRRQKAEGSLQKGIQTPPLIQATELSFSAGLIPLLHERSPEGLCLLPFFGQVSLVDRE